MNTEKNKTKEVFQVWQSVGKESYSQFQSESLKEIGHYQDKLISLGIVSWIQIKKEENNK